MKILTVAWNIFIKTEYGYEISRNGGSIMISDIAEYIGRKEESYLFQGSIRVPNMEYGSIHVLANEEYLPSERTKENIGEWHKGLQRRFREILKEIKPSIVLVQGAGDFTENCVNTCIDCGQRYTFVDHSYFGKGNDKYDKENWPEWEERIFSTSDLHVIMVGNGMRNRMLVDYPTFPVERVVAIPNGTHFGGEKKLCDIKEKYNLLEKRVLVCVGRIYKRKNQIQLTRIVKLLPDEVREQVCFLVCGKESANDQGIDDLKKAIKKENVENEVIYIGSLDEEGMKGLYTSVDGLIMPSLSEGLSLVVLEMLTYGKPVILFSDNETATDVNKECAVVLAKERTDQALADAVTKWFYKEWKDEEIKEYAKYFSMERVADDYIEYCRKRIECE